jgi:membrane-associated protease RseP (regulator of RpoE activity)
MVSACTGLQQLIFNFNGVKNQVSGPVAIVAAGAEVARIDFAGLYQFAAIVSINLAVVNALPLPALDGGYMLLLVRSELIVPSRVAVLTAPADCLWGECPLTCSCCSPTHPRGREGSTDLSPNPNSAFS